MGVRCKVPELRFKEFSGEWEEKKLIELSENGFSNGAFNDPKKVGSGYRIINVKDMYVDGTIDISHLSKVALDEKEYLNNRVHYGDIFFTRSSLVKEGIAYSNVNLSNADDLTFDGHLIRMRPNKQNCSPIFLYYNFTTSYARKQFIIRGKTTTMTTIGQEDIASVKIVLPSKQEEEKIASFLSSVANRIEQLTKKEQLLREYKKGVMQKIFSQELRFHPKGISSQAQGTDDNGSEFPEWKEKKLQDLLSMIIDNRGKTPPVTDNGIPLIEVNAIGNKTINYSKVSKFVDNNTFNQWFRKYLQNGDILFSTVGQTAICSLYKNDVKAVIAQNIVGLRFRDSNNLFMFYLLIEKQNNHKFKRIEMGAVQPSVKVSQMIHINFLIPSLKEQTKIANFLSSLDTKIEQVSKELNLTKEFKKALLQKMFV